jgi:hypothetical protein
VFSALNIALAAISAYVALFDAVFSKFKVAPPTMRFGELFLATIFCADGV